MPLSPLLFSTIISIIQSRWEVQAAVRGSTDLTAKVQASRSLSSITQGLNSLNYLHQSTRRELMSLGRTWDLLVVLLSHPDLCRPTLESMEVLSRLIPSIIPIECLSLLILQLGSIVDNPPHSPSEFSKQQSNAGLAAQVLIHMMKHWRLALMMSCWKELQGCERCIDTCLKALPSIHTSYWMSLNGNSLTNGSSPSPHIPPIPSSIASSTVGVILQLVLKLMEVSTDERSSNEILQLSNNSNQWVEICIRCAQGLAVVSDESAASQGKGDGPSILEHSGLHFGLVLLERIVSTCPTAICLLTRGEYGLVAIMVLSRLLSPSGNQKDETQTNSRHKWRQDAWVASATILSRPTFWSPELNPASSILGGSWRSTRTAIVLRLKSWLLKSSAGQSSEFMRALTFLSSAILSSGPPSPDYGCSLLQSSEKDTVGNIKSTAGSECGVDEHEAKSLRGHLLDDPVTPIGNLLLLLEQHPPGSWPLCTHIGSSPALIQRRRDEDRLVSFHLLRELAAWGVISCNLNRFYAFVSSLSSVPSSRGGIKSRSEAMVTMARAASLNSTPPLTATGSSKVHERTSMQQGLAYDFALSLSFLALVPSSGSSTTRLSSWQSILHEADYEMRQNLNHLSNAAMSICGRDGKETSGQLAVEIVKTLGGRGKVEAMRLISQHLTLCLMLRPQEGGEEKGWSAALQSLARGLNGTLSLLTDSILASASSAADDSMVLLQPAAHISLMAMLQLTAEDEGQCRRLVHDLSSKQEIAALKASLESFLRHSSRSPLLSINGDTSRTICDRLICVGLREMTCLASLLLLRLFDQAGVPSSIFIPSSDDSLTWTDPELSDITLILPHHHQACQIVGHSVILEASSPALARKIKEKRVKSPARPLELTLSSSVDPESFSLLHGFMSNGSCLLPPSASREKLSKLAKAIQIEPLSSLLRLDLPSKGQHLSSSLIGAPHLTPPMAIALDQDGVGDATDGRKHELIEDILLHASTWRLHSPSDTPFDPLESSTHDVLVVAPWKHNAVAFAAHRVILSARHSYFGSLFSRWMVHHREADASRRCVTLPEADALVTCLILQYLYTGSVRLMPADDLAGIANGGSHKPSSSCGCDCFSARACVRSKTAAQALLLPAEFTTLCTALCLNVIIGMNEPSCLLAVLRDATMMENDEVADATRDQLALLIKAGAAAPAGLAIDHLKVDCVEDWEVLHDAVKESIEQQMLQRPNKEQPLQGPGAPGLDLVGEKASELKKENISKLDSCLIQLYG